MGKKTGIYTKDWDNLTHCLLHRLYLKDLPQVKTTAFVYMAGDHVVLSLGEMPAYTLKWEQFSQKSINDEYYLRIKILEQANKEAMIRRSDKNRFQVIADDEKLIISIDKAQSKYTVDQYSGKEYADVCVRMDYVNPQAIGEMIQSRKEKGLPTRGWEKLRYTIAKCYFDFQRNRVLYYGISSYTEQGTQLDYHETAVQERNNWSEVVPGTLGEKIFMQTKKIMLPSQ